MQIMTKKTQLKHTLGPLAKYKTVKELNAKIQDYFAACVPVALTINGKAVLDKNGRPVLQDNPPTVSGLALFLGFADRQSIYDYKKQNESFSYAVKRAVTQIEEYAEKRLLTGEKPIGAIFWLKNHGWTAEEKRNDIVQVGPAVIDDVQ